MKKRYLIPIFLTIFSGCSYKSPFIRPVDYVQQPTILNPTTCNPNRSNAMYRATMKPYTVRGKQYCPTIVNIHDTFNGTASWYGDKFHGRQTSNGEYYNMYDLTAAHKTLPINTMLKVTNLRNNQTTTVRINDRGPFVADRIIDLSFAAAQEIGMIKKGTAPVKLEVLDTDTNANKYAKKAIIKVKPVVQTIAKSTIQTPTFSIQIASLSFQNKAQALKNRCYNANNNYQAYVNELQTGDKTMYKVMIGSFRSIKEAKDFIQEANYKGAFVVRDSI
jgi:rare lipoprotein A